MLQEELLALIGDLLEEETLTGEENLENLESWDSMAMLEYIALIDEKCGIILPADALNQCKTVNDLIALAMK